MTDPTPPTLTCPRCGMAVYRVQRTLLDRVFSALVPQLRVRCEAEFCGWQGLVRRDAPGTAAFKHQASYFPQHVLEPSRGATPLSPMAGQKPGG